MSIDYLIHKNSYTKIHSGLTYGLMRISSSYHIDNCHNKLYDMFFALKPQNIVLQLEEYSNEFHAFAMDKSITQPNIYVSVDNNQANNKRYLDLLKQISGSPIKLIVHTTLADEIESNSLKFDMTRYDYLYNKDVFYPLVKERNNKILCILSTDKECATNIESLLYPNTNLPIVLINNPQVIADQNIGLMFDSDMNVALNTFEYVIDLSKSYDAEISVCGIKQYDVSKLPELTIVDNTIQSIEILDFIKTNMLGTSNE